MQHSHTIQTNLNICVVDSIQDVAVTSESPMVVDRHLSMKKLSRAIQVLQVPSRLVPVAYIFQVITILHDAVSQNLCVGPAIERFQGS